MAWTLLAHTAVTTGDASSVITPAINTTGADLLVVGLAYNVIGTPSLSDSYGNTWTQLGPSAAGSTTSDLFYVYGGTVGTNHTFSADGALTNPNVAVAAFSGSHSSPLDGNTGANSGIFNVNTISPGSLTPSENGELLVTTLAYAPDEAASISAGYTKSDNSFVATSRNVALAYRIQRTAVTSTPTWTWTSATASAAARFATFKILDYETFAPLYVASTWSEDKTAAQNSYTFPASGTWTPNASELVVVGVGTRKTVGPSTTPTLTGTNGWNVTWTLLEDVRTQGSTTTGLTMFWGIPTSGSAGTLTVDYGGTNQAQCGVVALSGANFDLTNFDSLAPHTDSDGSTDGSIGILDFAPVSQQIGYLVFGVSRGTPSGFVPDTDVHATTVTGGVMGLTGAWIEGDVVLAHVGDFTSGTNTATLLFEANVTGSRMTQGQIRNTLVS